MQPQTPSPASPESTPDGAIERLPQPIAPEQGGEKIEEKAVSGQEKGPAPGGDKANQNAGAPAMAVPQPIDPQATTQPEPPAQDIDDTPPVAGDVDLIEKTWVRKAKEVVESTRDDPHQQNKEVNRVKAGYIKKRYNKEVKLAE